MQPEAHPAVTRTPPHSDYRPDIDGLRAIAVLAVVGFHVAPKRITGGFVGVDVFFVISGFLISSIILNGLRRGTFSYTDFYIRRVRRIFPALALVSFCTLIAGWLLLLPDEYEQLGKHVVAGTLFVSNLQLWREAGYFDAASGLKPLLHLWSLGIEEQFYLFWPLTLAFLWKRAGSVAWWIASGAVLSFLLCVALAARQPSAAFYLPFARFWQLLVGALLAATAASANQPRAVPGWLRHLSSWIGLALIGISIATLDSLTLYPAVRSGLPTVGAALVLMAGPGATANRYLLTLKPLVFLGLISYPLYLWHWPLLSFLDIVQPPGPVRVYRIAAAGLALCLAAATYLLLEKRVRIPPFIPASRIVLASAVCLLLATAVVARSGFAAERGPWGIAALAGRFEPDQMGTAGCTANYGGLFKPRFLSERDFCTTDRSTGELVRVLGDSHANRLFLGLRAVDHSRAYENLGRGSCVPFLGYDAAWPGTGEELICRETVANLLDDSARLRDGVIVLHGFFTRAYTGMTLLTREGIRQQARATFAVLSTGGSAHIIVVLDVPELPFEPSSCVARPVMRSLARKDCAFPTPDWTERSKFVNDEIRSAAADHPNVAIFDPASVLCDARECHAERDGSLLYTDSHHLSQAGATLVAAELRRVFEAPVTPSESIRRPRARDMRSTTASLPSDLGIDGPAVTAAKGPHRVTN
jgi:peptidoglycan/LPS O-acetylase OafA/YrhL